MSKPVKLPVPSKASKTTAKTTQPVAPSSSAVGLDIRGQKMEDDYQLQQQHGRLRTAEQKRQDDENLVNVLGDAPIAMADAGEKVGELASDVALERQRTNMALSLGKTNDAFRNRDLQLPRNEHVKGQSDLQALETTLAADIRKLGRELPYAFLDTWAQIDQKRQKINELIGVAQKNSRTTLLLSGTHAREQRKKMFADLCALYNADRLHMSVGIEDAQRELDLITENPFYVPNLPPNGDADWKHRLEWLPVAQKFLDVAKAYFIPVDDWPVDYESWTESLAPMMIPVHAYYDDKVHEQAIIRLGGADPIRSKEFKDQLVAEYNTTFKSHVTKTAKSFSNKTVYYRPFYVGFIKALYIERQIVEKLGPITPATIDPEVLTEVPAPREYTAEEILSRIRDSLIKTFSEPDNLKDRSAAGIIFRLPADGGAATEMQLGQATANGAG